LRKDCDLYNANVLVVFHLVGEHKEEGQDDIFKMLETQRNSVKIKHHTILCTCSHVKQKINARRKRQECGSENEGKLPVTSVRFCMYLGNYHNLSSTNIELYVTWMYVSRDEILFIPQT